MKKYVVCVKTVMYDDVVVNANNEEEAMNIAKHAVSKELEYGMTWEESEIDEYLSGCSNFDAVIINDNYKKY